MEELHINLSAQGVEVCLPKELTLDKAIKINEKGLQYDGVERIEDDGTIILTDKSAGIMKQLLGIDLKTMELSDMEELVQELRQGYKKRASP